MRLASIRNTALKFTLVLNLAVPNAWAVALTTSQAWVRQPHATGKMTGAFLEITNPTKQDDQLLSASCDCAKVTEIHQSLQEKGMVKMRQVAAVEVKAGETVALKPGSYHIMLMGLTKPLKAGDTVNLQLKFKHAGVMAVAATVKSP